MGEGTLTAGSIYRKAARKYLYQLNASGKKMKATNALDNGADIAKAQE